MRRSQAPSIKVKPPSATINKGNSSRQTCTAIQECLLASRSTESVLELLFNSDAPLDEELILIPTENAKLEYDGNKNINKKAEKASSLCSNKVKELSKSSVSSVAVFNVVYGKQSKKKHKTWEGDGFLEIKSKFLTLKNEDGKVLGTGPCPKARKLEEGVRIFVGNKEVELLDQVSRSRNISKIEPFNEQKNGVCRSLIKEKTIKSHQGLGKQFLPPKLINSSGIVLPEPNAQHQWHFNQRSLPLSPVYIEASLSNKLRDHQQAGVGFLYECLMGFKDCNLTGAILADEMGLGKTLQCITLIWTLLKQGPYGNIPVVKKVLIVAPSSLIVNWYNEFIKWLGKIKLVPFCVNQKNKPSSMSGPVMIISYEMLVRYYEDVKKHNFDLLVCDEAHRLKNANIRTTHLLQSLNCDKRILLTGTPIQNDLQEFYCLVNFVNPNVLGSFSEFRKRYMEPILASRQPDADQDVLDKGRKCSQDLKKITSKFMLRRTRDILTNYLPPRHELVVFCRITDVQEKIYNFLIDSFIALKENPLGFTNRFVHLELIMALRKVCSHPCLLKNQNYEQVGSILKDVTPTSTEISSKVTVTLNFLKQLRETSPKEKVVLISNSTQTLDVLGQIFDSIGFTNCRLDGKTPAAQRNNIVERFNLSYSNAFVFLLSAKAGGVGLNLTGASRLILFDPDWNPATDLQAIARIWRDGQKFPVYIYRLLTAGTIEEKIYQRQISKQSLCEGTVDPENANSIKLSNEELKDIFSSCSLEEDCLTHSILSCDCNKNGEIPIPKLDPEGRNCQLMKELNSSIKISELFHWEHHGPPFNSEALRQLCLEKSQKEISFIFRTCKI